LESLKSNFYKLGNLIFDWKCLTFLIYSISNFNFIIQYSIYLTSQLIMNNTQCLNCNKDYSFANPPKKLKNCPHSICDACLPTAVSTYSMI
jgi:hypothetical protein